MMQPVPTQGSNTFFLEAMSRDDIYVFWAKTHQLNPFDLIETQLFKFFNAQDAEEISRLLRVSDRKLAFLSRLLVKLVIESYSGINYHNIVVERKATGSKPIWIPPKTFSKPFLHFNITHDADLVCMAVSQRPIGIDTMKIKLKGTRSLNDFLKSMKNQFSTTENRFIQEYHTSDPSGMLNDIEPAMLNGPTPPIRSSPTASPIKANQSFFRAFQKLRTKSKEKPSSDMSELSFVGESTKLTNFFYLWTMKESFVKAIGTGMYTEPQTLECKVPSLTSISLNNKQMDCRFCHFRLNKFVVCICVCHANNEYIYEKYKNLTPNVHGSFENNSSDAHNSKEEDLKMNVKVRNFNYSTFVHKNVMDGLQHYDV